MGGHRYESDAPAFHDEMAGHDDAALHNLIGDQFITVLADEPETELLARDTHSANDFDLIVA